MYEMAHNRYIHFLLRQCVYDIEISTNEMR